MKSNGLDVSEINLNAIKGNGNVDYHQKKCSYELRLLQSVKFDDTSLSCFDIIGTKEVAKLAGLARNAIIIKVIKYDEFITKFPIYGEMIVENLDKGILKNKDFELVKRFILYLASRDHDKLPTLPMTAINEIFSYLNFENVANLRKL